jgi:hypothetical protein
MQSKTTPLRCWASASYDPKSGKPASALASAGTRTVIEDMPINPSAQIPSNDRGRGGAPSWKERTKEHTQGGS